MRLLSTFELLVKPLIPKRFDAVGSGRTVVQGYFLTITNLSETRVVLNLRFHAKSRGLDAEKFVAFFDVEGIDQKFDVLPEENMSEFKLGIPGKDTALFILQPNVTSQKIIDDADIEVRGFVEVDVEGERMRSILFTPEHRGTFLPPDVNFEECKKQSSPDFDQLIYALPLAEGQALYVF